MNQPPLLRGICTDCAADFPIHKAIREIVSPDPTEGEIEILVCPECGSYSVEEGGHEQLA
ncbi:MULTISPECIES: hypothetical protein [unclassified Pseudomonas]|uniref:hypothetical protein n=1 Tax=unclassified Pseudomonas TaxID=196821 RepID=UPI002B23EA9A|nr:MULTISPECIES: hypothetical protein [unclassified Pseudomonas]MEA9976514.1 hypothetical protein [Pseudomonas sp. RTS4]MEB0198352.1 hypothetical protein [Pseudomonas sp. 5S4]MEB0244067.1 hypothetical protein [Pseudomonas sp. 10S5]